MEFKRRMFIKMEDFLPCLRINYENKLYQTFLLINIKLRFEIMLHFENLDKKIYDIMKFKNFDVKACRD